MKKIGFIGVGNMGGALAARVIHDFSEEKQILVSSRTLEKATAFAEEWEVTALSNRELAAAAEILFLGVKPQKMQGLFEEIAPVLQQRQDRFVLVSMAAGLTVEQIGQMAGCPCPVLRIMPNTPCRYGKGVIPYCGNSAATEEDFQSLEAILASCGWVFPLEEGLMDAAGAVSGCGPAFAYLFIEALADGGVACGLPRATAQKLAAQMLSGAAETVLRSNMHPGQLKDEVCSPGGSTIAGVRALEEGGFRAAAQNAVLAAWKRSRELGK